MPTLAKNFRWRREWKSKIYGNL